MLLAVPYFALAGPRLGIGACAVLMIVTGFIGLVRFGIHYVSPRSFGPSQPINEEAPTLPETFG